MQKHRSPLYRAISVDLRRAFISGSFILTVAAIVFWERANLFFSVPTQYAWAYADVISLFSDAVSNTAFFGAALLPIATVPYAGSVLTDRKTGFQRQAVQRVGIHNYALSRLFVVILSAFAAAAISALIIVAYLLTTGIPLYRADTLQYANSSYFHLVLDVSPAFYFFVQTTVSGLSAALAAVFALNVSLIVPNSYVALLSPLLLFYGWDAVIASVFDQAGGRFLLNNNMFFQLFPHDSMSSFLWSASYLLLWIVVLGVLFYCLVTRREDI